jgi:hypothetical protein
MSTDTNPRHDETDSKLSFYLLAAAIVLINAALWLIVS